MMKLAIVYMTLLCVAGVGAIWCLFLRLAIDSPSFRLPIISAREAWK